MALRWQLNVLSHHLVLQFWLFIPIQYDKSHEIIFYIKCINWLSHVHKYIFIKILGLEILASFFSGYIYPNSCLWHVQSCSVFYFCCRFCNLPWEPPSDPSGLAAQASDTQPLFHQLDACSLSLTRFSVSEAPPNITSWQAICGELFRSSLPFCCDVLPGTLYTSYIISSFLPCLNSWYSDNTKCLSPNAFQSQEQH